MESQFNIMKKCIRFNDVLKFHPDYYGLMGVSERFGNTAYLSAVKKEICSACLLRENCKILKFRHYVQRNVIINYFLHDEEVIVYKAPLHCLADSNNVEVGGKSTYVDVNGVLIPRDGHIKNEKFLDNMNRSANYSLDRFYGYGLSNEWDYFITLTTDKINVDRFDDEAVKALWKKCREAICYFDSNAKIIITPERHKNSALHFHGLVAMAKPWAMKLYIDPSTGKQKYTSLGSPLFEFPFWKYGIATCAVLPKEDNQRRVINYLVKYVSKSNDIGYKKKRYYRTHNMNFKDQQVLNLNAEEIEYVISGYEVYKDTDDKTIYRKRIETLETDDEKDV